MDFRESVYDRLLSSKKSNVVRYQEMFIGKYDYWSLVKYEILINFFGLVPGAAGLVLRKFTHKHLFASVGNNVVFGRNLTVRYPHEIQIGNNVIIDDNCLLDAKGIEKRGIILNDNIIIGRNSSLICKEGRIVVGSNTQITFDVSIIMVTGDLFIGEGVGIGAGTRIVGGNHPVSSEIDEEAGPEWLKPPISNGIKVKDRALIGANVTILDGVTIGRNTIVGAGSLVTKDLPENVVAVGIPARIIRERKVKKINPMV